MDNENEGKDSREEVQRSHTSDGKERNQRRKKEGAEEKGTPVIESTEIHPQQGLRCVNERGESGGTTYKQTHQLMTWQRKEKLTCPHDDLHTNALKDTLQS